MTNQKLVNKVNRTPAHATNRLNSFALLAIATEFTKFETNDIIEQTKKICPDRLNEIVELYASYDVELPSDSWTINKSRIR